MMHVVLKRLPWWWCRASSPRRSGRWPEIFAFFPIENQRIPRYFFAHVFCRNVPFLLSFFFFHFLLFLLCFFRYCYFTRLSRDTRTISRRLIRRPKTNDKHAHYDTKFCSDFLSRVSFFSVLFSKIVWSNLETLLAGGPISCFFLSLSLSLSFFRITWKLLRAQ